MKKNISSIVFLLTLLFSQACSTDVTLEGEWKNIPIVYGFLSLQDTAHYIRVEKAFLEPGANALDVAQNPDSLYYDESITVLLEKVATGQSYELERVDGNLEGYPREDGTFADSPNILYKIDRDAIDLKAGDEVRLVINRGDELDPATATTSIIGDLLLLDNLPPDILGLDDYTRNIRIGWRVSQEARIFDVRVTVHYRETLTGNAADLSRKELVWVLDKAFARDETSGSEQVNYVFKGEDFFRYIGNTLDPIPSGYRILDSLDVQVVGAGEEFVELLRIANANSGITSSGQIPVYSNVDEGLGIFSSRSTATRTGILLNNSSLDSLSAGIHTKNLSFQ